MDKATASKIVDKIIRDLNGRSGIGDEFDQIDQDIKDEIREKWISFIWSDSDGNKAP